MISLVFLVCSLEQQCFSVAPQRIFRDTMQCEMFAEYIMIENQRKVDRGEMEPHLARYECVDWGVPS